MQPRSTWGQLAKEPLPGAQVLRQHPGPQVAIEAQYPASQEQGLQDLLCGSW